MNRQQAQNLLDVASILRDLPDDADFAMHSVSFECGTPACAWGHYAARSDIQDSFIMNSRGEVSEARTGMIACYCGLEMQQHFGINMIEAIELFGSTGCGDAKHPLQAARYIEKFLDRFAAGFPRASSNTRYLHDLFLQMAIEGNLVLHPHQLRWLPLCLHRSLANVPPQLSSI